MGTGDTVPVEINPHDRVWDVGYSKLGNCDRYATSKPAITLMCVRGLIRERLEPGVEDVAAFRPARVAKPWTAPISSSLRGGHEQDFLGGWNSAPRHTVIGVPRPAETQEAGRAFSK
jgi:hypothetical protein